MNDTDFEKAYYDSLVVFNNVHSDLREKLDVLKETYGKEKINRKKAECLHEITILIGKLLMLDQVMCWMFHNIGMEVEKHDYRSEL